MSSDPRFGVISEPRRLRVWHWRGGWFCNGSADTIGEAQLIMAQRGGTVILPRDQEPGPQHRPK